MDDSLEPHYFDVVFETEPPSEGLPRRFGVVTAHNPLNLPTPAADNQKANADLERALVADNRRHFRVTGASRDGSHSEPGFGVAALSLQEMRVYCRLFSQAAFYWVDGGELYVVNTESPLLHRVDRWDARQLPSSAKNS